MSDQGVSEDREKQRLELKAALADATVAVAALDMSMVMLAADIVAAPPFSRQDLEVGSLLVFSQTTIERRIDVVRKLINLRLGPLSAQKPHEYGHKISAFVMKAFNITAAAATKEIWIRNLAAHGNFYHPQTGDLKIIPSPFDFDGTQRFNERRGRDPRSFDPDAGLTAVELIEFAKSLKQPQTQFSKIREILVLILRDGPAAKLEEALIELGKDLKLQAPLRVRPPRGKRGPKQRA